MGKSSSKQSQVSESNLSSLIVPGGSLFPQTEGQFFGRRAGEILNTPDTRFGTLFGVPGEPRDLGRLGGFQEASAGLGRANELLANPNFSTNEVQQAFLDQVTDQVAGNAAQRGLGLPTEGALVQALAPQLLALRNQEIQNNLGLGGAGTGLFGQGVQARGDEIAAFTGRKGQALQTLVDLASLGQPVVIGGTTGTSSGSGSGSSKSLFG